MITATIAYCHALSNYNNDFVTANTILYLCVGAFFGVKMTILFEGYIDKHIPIEYYFEIILIVHCSILRQTVNIEIE